MANSLLTGISGLRGHQKMLEVIGNNLANVNTTAFKTARTLFSDLMYETQRGASAGTEGILGSVNPLMIGTGSRIASVDLNFSQGNLESTGETLDVAIEGNGFFVASNRNEQFFTRAGALGLDEDGFLVDPSTGYLIQRVGDIGEDLDLGPVIQKPGDSRIHVPIGASVPGQVTTEISFGGQLGADATGPTQRLIQGIQLTERHPTDPSLPGTPATGATLINDLESTIEPYTTDPVSGASDQLRFIASDRDGEESQVVMDVNETTTVQDIVDQISALFPDDTVTLEVDGCIKILDSETGSSKVNLTISRPQNTTGNSTTDFFSAFEPIDPGYDATVVSGSVPIFDERGKEHTLSYQMTKQVDGTWVTDFDMAATSGVLIDSQITGISFDSDGSLRDVTDTEIGMGRIAVQFANATTPQVIDVDLGTRGDFDGFSEIGSKTEVSFVTDGASPGELTTVQIDMLGVITGIASNGATIPIAQLAVASFRNPDGLTLNGSNYYSESLASGTAEIGTAASGDRGAIRSGQLEGSNVDLAVEFTRLLVAQRGFSANARTITVTDEMLEELTNIIR